MTESVVADLQPLAMGTPAHEAPGSFSGDSFQRQLETVRLVLDGMDVSENTLSQYKREVVPFLQFLTKQARFYPDLLLDWKRYLEHRKDIGTGTKAKYLTVGRVLMRELHRLYPTIVPDVTAGVRGFRVTKAHKRAPLTDDDVSAVFQYLDAKGPSELRTKVMVGLMYFQGLRRVEVSRLQVNDVNLEERILLVPGKSRDNKGAVDLHPRMVTILWDYLKETGLRWGWLFPSRKQPGQGLCPNMVWRIVMGVHKELGISKNVHAYRKVFTSKLIASGMNLLDVRTYTRHRDITQLQTYDGRIERAKTLPKYYEVFGAA